MPKYKYSRKPPGSNLYQDVPHRPGHKLGITKRKDMLSPRAKIDQKPYCECKWQSDKWCGNRRQMLVEFTKHIIEVEKQGTLFVVPDVSTPEGTRALDLAINQQGGNNAGSESQF